MSSAAAELDCISYDDGYFSCSLPGIYYVKLEPEKDAALEVSLYGKALDQLIANYEKANKGSKIDPIMYYVYLKSRKLPYESREFRECMKARGLIYYEDEDASYKKGYIAFEGDEDKEIYFKLDSFKAEREKSVYTLQFNILPIYDSDFDDDDWAYFRKVVTAHWKVLVEAIYDSIVAYLKGEECDPVLAAKAAEAAAAAKLAAKEEELWKSKQRKAAERKKNIARKSTLKKSRGAPLNNGLAKLENISKYSSSNEGYVTPTKKNVTLKSRISGLNNDLSYNILIAVQNAATKKHLVEGGVDNIIKEDDVFEKIYKPIITLVSKGAICGGISQNFVRKSIRGNSATGHKGADIILLLHEVPSAEVAADDTYIAGMATLIVKPAAIEVDVICSQIAYKMGGTLLMNKIIEIARLLGKEKIELLSVYGRDTVRFYTDKFGFKRVKPEDPFAMEAKRKGLIPLRRRVTRKKPAGGAGAKA